MSRVSKGATTQLKAKPFILRFFVYCILYAKYLCIKVNRYFDCFTFPLFKFKLIFENISNKKFSINLHFITSLWMKFNYSFWVKCTLNVHKSSMFYLLDIEINCVSSDLAIGKVGKNFCLFHFINLAIFSLFSQLDKL